MIEMSIHRIQWFLKAVDALSTGKNFEFSPASKITPSGVALIELLREEARVRNIALSIKKNPAPEFPVHDKSYSLDWFEGGLKPLFLERFLEIHAKTISEDRAFELRLLFNELTQNALDHSGSEKFLVLLEPHAIGVFDLGVSIPAKLEQKYIFQSDTEAIEMAMKEGVTTRRLRSGGLGLHYTLDLLKKEKGTLLIASRRGQLRRYIKSKKITRLELDPKMPGTLVYCDLGDES